MKINHGKRFQFGFLFFSERCFISDLALVSSPEVACGFRHDSNHRALAMTYFYFFHSVSTTRNILDFERVF